MSRKSNDNGPGLFCLLQSLDDFGDDEDDYDDRGYDEDNEDEQDYLEFKDDRRVPEKKESGTFVQAVLS